MHFAQPGQLLTQHRWGDGILEGGAFNAHVAYYGEELKLNKQRVKELLARRLTLNAAILRESCV